MSTALLTTKMYVPTLRHGFVSRPRLIEQLNTGLWQEGSTGRKLTLVAAPAGFGKTTLLAEWVHRLGEMDVPALPSIKTAWLSLDAHDNDPVRFWTYFVAALRRADPDVGTDALAALEASALAHTAEAAPVERALLRLINQLAESTSAWVVVLDDYQTIAASSIHSSLAFLIEHLPPQMHLVLVTRVDPPLPVARLRGRGQMLGLYQADLRFTGQEVAEFFGRVADLELSDQNISALQERTEGWIAGLQMAVLAMQAFATQAPATQAASVHGREGVADFVQAFTGSHRFILDYLGEEVLRQQPENVRTFLLRTAILGRMTSSLCDGVVGWDAPIIDEPLGTDSQAILEYLERNNLFVVPLDDERRWYRYHHLFADLLRHRLQREERDLVPELHRRASEWYERNHSIPDAVSHALHAADYERAAGLVERTAWAMLTRGEFARLLGWLEALPDRLVRSRSRLCVLCAWALTLTGRFDRAETYLVDLDAQCEQEADAIRAHIAGLRDDGRRAIELAQQAFAHLPAENLFLRGYLALNLGLAHWRSGDMAAGSRILGEAISFGRTAKSTYLTLVATARLGHVQEMQGKLHQALATHQAALELSVEQSGWPVPYAGVAHAGIAEVLYEQNDLDGALYHATEGIRLCERGGISSYLLASRFILAQISQARGDAAAALSILQSAERLALKYGYAFLLAEQAELRTLLWIRRGNVLAASRWAVEHSPGDVRELDLTIAREKELVAIARVLVAQGASRVLAPHYVAVRARNVIGQALRLLATLHQAAEAAGQVGSVIRIRGLQALAFQARGDTDRALAALEQALLLGEPEGYVRTFVDEGEQMAGLLRQALARQIALDYVARILAAFDQESAPSSLSQDSLVEPLSEREVQVLRLIVAGLSNLEIADELVIAVSTVKSHVNHIFGKLGVDSRARAVAKTRELGLL